MSRLMVVTDLDGSLLDHYTYSWAPAAPLLEELAADNIPLVLCSSKTRAEMQVLRRQLGLETPYIVENGAAIYFPRKHWPTAPPGCELRGEDWCHAFGEGRDYWLRVLLDLPDELRPTFRRFSAMSTGQIADLTGLSLDDAGRAAQREFGEPLQWRGNDEQKQALVAALAQSGARILEGGRLLHVTGHWDKGRALDWLADHINGAEGERPVTIALGDSQNDVAMLESADYAVVIRSPVHAPPALERTENVVFTEQAGPRGWTAGLRAVLESIDI